MKIFHELRVYHYELDASGNPITDDKYIIECGIIAQQIKGIPELAYCVNGEEEVEAAPAPAEDSTVHEIRTKHTQSAEATYPHRACLKHGN